MSLFKHLKNKKTINDVAALPRISIDLLILTLIHAF